MCHRFWFPERSELGVNWDSKRIVVLSKENPILFCKLLFVFIFIIYIFTLLYSRFLPIVFNVYITIYSTAAKKSGGDGGK